MVHHRLHVFVFGLKRSKSDGEYRANGFEGSRAAFQAVGRSSVGGQPVASAAKCYCHCDHGRTRRSQWTDCHCQVGEDQSQDVAKGAGASTWDSPERRLSTRLGHLEARCLSSMLCDVADNTAGVEKVSCFFGRPWGRRVLSSPNRRTVCSNQKDSPKGHPRLTERRSANSSASVCGMFTSAAQLAKRRSGQAAINDFSLA